MAAQQWAAIAREHGDLDGDLGAGRFEAVNDWRRRKIWSRGSFGSTVDILRDATGEELNPGHFIAHLERRYGEAELH
jgi:carboxypeptidase Taq